MIWLWIYLAGAAVWVVIGGAYWQLERDRGTEDERTPWAIFLVAVFWPVSTLLAAGIYLAGRKKTPLTAGDKSRDEP